MPVRSKPARIRPPEPLPDPPPTRKAKIIAKNSIAAQSMQEETLQASSSCTEKKEEKLVNSTLTVVKKEEGPEMELDSNSDVCAICLAAISDPTVLDSCSHSFCYLCTTQWLKHAGKCPLCMKKTEKFWHHMDSSKQPEEIVVADLQAAAEAERLANRGQSQPPLDELECIRLRIRRLQRRLALVQQQMNTNARVSRSSELSKTNVRLVNEIARLEMLKRDVTTRGELLGNIVFRSLIYKDGLEWSCVDRNSNRVPFTPEIFCGDAAESSNRLRTFLERELQIVWRSRKRGETEEEYRTARSTTAERIIVMCSEYQINSPQFSRNLRLAGVFPQYLDRFQSELFEFASSRMSLLDFDRTSAYSSPELRHTLHRRSRRGDNAEVVMLSDSDSDGAVIALGGGAEHERGERGNTDVIVLSDDNATEDEAASSTSEASNGDLYTRPALRLPHTRSGSVPLSVTDAFGHDLFRDLWLNLYNEYHGYFAHTSPMPTRTAAINDATIILSSDDETPTTSSREQHRRNVPSSQSSRGDYSNSSMGSAQNEIDWLMPANDVFSQHSSITNNASASCPRNPTEFLPTACHVPSTSSQHQPLPEVIYRQNSLFNPSNAKKLPSAAPVEVRGENKTLCNLWKERQSRHALLASSAENRVAPEVYPDQDKAHPSTCDRGVQQSGEDSHLVPQPRPSSCTGVEVFDASSPSTHTAPSTTLESRELISDPRTHSASIRSKRRTHRRKSWKSIFRQFRRKLRYEKSLRKREKCYNFLLEMKRLLEADKRGMKSTSGRSSSNIAEANLLVIRGNDRKENIALKFARRTRSQSVP